MKLVTYQDSSKQELLGLLFDTAKAVLPLTVLGLNFRDMNDLILHSTEEDMTKLRQAAVETWPEEQLLALDQIRLLAPIPRPLQDVICLGMNYHAHAVECAAYDKNAFTVERPSAVYFSKRVTTCTGDGEGVPAHEDLVTKLDYEVELAVIIGKDALNVKKEDAADYIFGYSILNDVSARDLQTEHKQWYFGKSLDGFTPMGPAILTADSTAFPPALGLRCYINGELRQDSNTNLLMHTIGEIIEELSQGMTLTKGTIIATGTPVGVGLGFDPPKFLKKGDVMQLEIDEIGTLTNTIV